MEKESNNINVVKGALVQYYKISLKKKRKNKKHKQILKKNAANP